MVRNTRTPYRYQPGGPTGTLTPAATAAAIAAATVTSTTPPCPPQTPASVPGDTACATTPTARTPRPLSTLSGNSFAEPKAPKTPTTPTTPRPPTPPTPRPPTGAYATHPRYPHPEPTPTPTRQAPTAMLLLPTTNPRRGPTSIATPMLVPLPSATPTPASQDPMLSCTTPRPRPRPRAVVPPQRREIPPLTTESPWLAQPTRYPAQQPSHRFSGEAEEAPMSIADLILSPQLPTDNMHRTLAVSPPTPIVSDFPAMPENGHLANPSFEAIWRAMGDNPKWYFNLGASPPNTCKIIVDRGTGTVCARPAHEGTRGMMCYGHMCRLSADLEGVLDHD